MKYRYYFAELYCARLKEYLDNNKIKYETWGEDAGGGPRGIKFIIWSTTKNVGKYLQELKEFFSASPQISAEYTEAEYAKAELLWMTPKSQTIDIKNEDAYRYSCEWINSFGRRKVAHPEQVEKFIVAKEPSMKTKTAFWCEDTGFANIFADYRVKDLVEKNSLQGIVFQNVILKKGICSENLFQLISPNVLGKECIGMGFGEKIITCPKCGKEQYGIDNAYQLHLDFSKISKQSDLYMTESIWGEGFARPIYVISQRFYRLLKESNLAGRITFSPVVDISVK